ncbi:hypothetical protein ACJX0J_006581 [Zea mays]
MALWYHRSYKSSGGNHHITTFKPFMSQISLHYGVHIALVLLSVRNYICILGSQYIQILGESAVFIFLENYLIWHCALTEVHICSELLFFLEDVILALYMIKIK